MSKLLNLHMSLLRTLVLPFILKVVTIWLEKDNVITLSYKLPKLNPTRTSYNREDGRLIWLPPRIQPKGLENIVVCMLFVIYWDHFDDIDLILLTTYLCQKTHKIILNK